MARGLKESGGVRRVDQPYRDGPGEELPGVRVAGELQVEAGAAFHELIRQERHHAPLGVVQLAVADVGREHQRRDQIAHALQGDQRARR